MLTAPAAVAAPACLDDSGGDGGGHESAGVPPRPERAPRRARRALGVFAGYLVVSLWIWRHLLPHLATHSLSGGLLDPGIFIWWMQWTPFALTHGLDPLRTNYVDAPLGVSAMWNTSVPAIGVLFAPVTLISNSVLSFNLACILGPPLSAWTAWLWLRRYGRDVAAVLGGAVFGFSPFVIAESHAGHLMFTWLCLLPVIAMLVEDVLWRAPKPLWPAAPLLGLAVAAQLFVSTEALLIVALGWVGVTLLLVVTNPRAARRRAPIALGAGAVAVAVAGTLCAWPLYEQFRGGVAIRHPVQAIGVYGGHPAMLFEANRFLEFHTGSGAHGHLTSVENGLYIGWPLLALLVLTGLVLFRRRGVLVACAAIVVAADFQMYATHWRIAGQSVSTPLHLLQTHVGVTADILPGRFALVMWLAIAWLLAIAVDAALTRAPGQWKVVPVAVALLCVLPLLPGPEVTARLTPTPALFDTALRRTIPPGATVMVAPMATVADSAAELWQVQSGMRFRQLGGYILHAVNPDGTPSYAPNAAELTLLFGIDLSNGRAYKATPNPAQIVAARAELQASGATMFIVGYSKLGEARQLALAARVVGRPPDRVVGGASIWDLSPRR